MRPFGLILALMLAWSTSLLAQEVDFSVSGQQKLGEIDTAYSLDMSLNVVSPTRIGVDSVLDLRDLQKQIPSLVANRAVLDNCGLQVEIMSMTVGATGQQIDVLGETTIRTFKCGRTGETDFKRGKLTREIGANLNAAGTVELKDNCVFFELLDMELSLPDLERDPLIEDDTLADVKDLLLAAVRLVLNETPLCPELPPELAALEPTYDAGGPQEIGDGGLGVALKGSVDVSTSTILDILTFLQNQDLLPGRP